MGRLCFKGEAQINEVVLEGVAFVSFQNIPARLDSLKAWLSEFDGKGEDDKLLEVEIEEMRVLLVSFILYLVLILAFAGCNPIYFGSRTVMQNRCIFI